MPEGQAAIDIAILNARVWTADPRRPWADAVAIRGDRIALVGSAAEVQKAIAPSTRVIDAAGGLLVPGFIDAHLHLLDGGMGLAAVQLRDAHTPDEFTRRIADHARTLPPGSWITAGQWDHEQWGGALPTRDWIDAVTPDHPVWVTRLDGHMALANTAALRAAGIHEGAPDVEGGTVVRDATGRPTGLLKDNAQRAVQAVVPRPSAAQLARALDAAMAYLASHGVTSVHDMGSLTIPDPFASIDAFTRARDDRRLRTRIYAAAPIAHWEAVRHRIATTGRGDHWLRIGAVKGFVDGSLGSHTAAMLEDFSDAPGERGLLMHPPEQLEQWIIAAADAELHPIVHAIGDRANRILLDIYERLDRARPGRDRRARIEHAQHLHPDDIARFARLGVIASMQPYHAADDGRWAERVIGSRRAATTYPWRSLLDAGATVAFGSDWFVAPPIPLLGIAAAVTRATIDGAQPGGWIPGQRITVEEALRAYTATAAFASFEEAEKGTLARGRLADLALIDRDIVVSAPETIGSAAVVLTIVGGQVVYDCTA